MERAHRLETLLDEIQARIGGAPAGFDPEAAALGLQILALVVEAQRLRTPSRAITGFVARAERLLMDSVDKKPPAIPGLARDLGVAYSLLSTRSSSGTQGLAPYQYVRRLRMWRRRAA